MHNCILRPTIKIARFPRQHQNCTAVTGTRGIKASPYNTSWPISSRIRYLSSKTLYRAPVTLTSYSDQWRCSMNRNSMSHVIRPISDTGTSVLPSAELVSRLVLLFFATTCCCSCAMTMW